MKKKVFKEKLLTFLNVIYFLKLLNKIVCLPIWCAYKRVSRIFFMIYGRDAKVAQFHGSILGQQQVACFHVAMYHKAFVMQISERLECFTNNVFYLRLG